MWYDINVHSNHQTSGIGVFLAVLVIGWIFYMLIAKLQTSNSSKLG